MRPCFTSAALNGPRCRQGFTLIEVLISLAILSLILTAAYSTFFLSGRAMEGIDDSLLRLQEGRSALDRLCREAEALMFSTDNNKTFFLVEDRDVYGKQASRIQFTTFSSLSPGLSLVSYYVEEKDGGMILYKKVANPYIEDAGAKGLEIIEGLDSFTVEVRDGSKWVRTWNAAEVNKVPEEIRITVTGRMRDRTFTLYETVTPRIGSKI